MHEALNSLREFNTNKWHHTQEVDTRVSCSRSSIRGQTISKQKTNDTTVYKRVGGIARNYIFVREQKYLFPKETFRRVSI